MTSPDSDPGVAGSMRLKAQRALPAFGQLPWWSQVGLIWLLSRMWVLIWSLVVAANQGVSPWASANPDYFDFASFWDAGYYRSIYDDGYPAQLPRDADGVVVENSWAFYPAFPFLVRLVSFATGLSWEVAAPLVALMASLGFVLVAYKLFRLHGSHSVSIAAIALLSFAPAAPVLQYAYAESLAFLLVAVALYLLVSERYLAASLAVLLAGLARPVAAPLALTCLIVAGWQLVEARRKGDGLGRPKVVSLTVLVITALVAVGLWPAVAAQITGEPNAYFLTEAAWQLAGSSQLVSGPLFGVLLGAFGPWFAVVATILLMTAITAGLLSPPMRQLGWVMWAWCGSWIGYQMLLNGIGRADARLALTAFPVSLALILASPKPFQRWLLVLLAAASQVLWISVFWHWAGGTHANPIP